MSAIGGSLSRFSLGARVGVVWLVIFGLTMPLAVLLSVQLARKSFEKVSLRGRTIVVKGFAERPIESDFAMWSGTLIARGPDVASASARLEEARRALLDRLGVEGFGRESIGVGVVTVTPQSLRDKDGNYTNTIEIYTLRQSIWASSSRVRQVESLSREVSDLLTAGIELDASPPRYLFSGLEGMKLDMISAASGNARERAMRLLEGGGSRLGSLRSASQGVFQITPPLTTEIDNAGMNDTSSISKVIKAVVTCEFEIE
jgi:hypothetical protein